MTWSWFLAGLLGFPHCQKKTRKNATLKPDTRMKKVVIDASCQSACTLFLFHSITATVSVS